MPAETKTKKKKKIIEPVRVKSHDTCGNVSPGGVHQFNFNKMVKVTSGSRQFEKSFK